MNPDLPIMASDSRYATASETDSALPDAAILCEELAEQKDLNLRLAADFESFKRRSRQDAEVRSAALKEAFIHELLPIVDNLERALGSRAAAGSPQLREGVELTVQQLHLLLRQHGIETEESIGQPFDPHRHEAVSQRHDPDHADHAILEVFQRGYRRGERLFRPAKVVVNNRARASHHPPAR